MKIVKSILLILILFVSFSCKKSESREGVYKKEKVDTFQVNVNDKSKIISQSLDRDCNQNFEEFIDVFGSDSVFQKQRVKYPLKWKYIEDLEDSKLETDLIGGSAQFNYIDFTEDKNAMQKESGKYEVFIQKDKDSANYQLKGYDNGLYISYKFKLINGCWFLVEILDEST